MPEAPLAGIILSGRSTEPSPLSYSLCGITVREHLERALVRAGVSSPSVLGEGPCDLGSSSLALALSADSASLLPDTILRLLLFHAESGASCAVIAGGKEQIPLAISASSDALRRSLHGLRDEELAALDLAALCERLKRAGVKVTSMAVEDDSQVVPIANPFGLALATSALQKRLLKAHAERGVFIQDLGSVFVDVDVQIGPGSVIAPFTTVRGATLIGKECAIGPSTHIDRCEIGDGCTIVCSHLNRARIASGVRIGPYANIRPHTVIGENAKIGNFVELKNAQIGEQASASHLAYIGDASVGANANIGAGTITCNYDGFAKHRTEIGENAFVGSNSTLVAPVTIGEGAIVAAGSVITKDVPPNALGIGRERQENKEEWARKWRSRRQCT